MSKRGRKRKAGKREPNGRLSRRKADVQVRIGEVAKEARSVAIEARMRVFGMTKEQASKTTSGFALGRALDAMEALGGGRTATHLAAADCYLEDYRLYHRHKLGVPVPGDRKPSAPESDADYEKLAKTARERWDAAQGVISDVCREVGTRLPATAVENIIIRDIDMPNLHGDLRLALNALARHYLVGKRRAA